MKLRFSKLFYLLVLLSIPLTVLITQKMCETLPDYPDAYSMDPKIMCADAFPVPGAIVAVFMALLQRRKQYRSVIDRIIWFAELLVCVGAGGYIFYHICLNSDNWLSNFAYCLHARCFMTFIMAFHLIYLARKGYLAFQLQAEEHQNPAVFLYRTGKEAFLAQLMRRKSIILKIAFLLRCVYWSYWVCVTLLKLLFLFTNLNPLNSLLYLGSGIIYDYPMLIVLYLPDLLLEEKIQLADTP